MPVLHMLLYLRGDAAVAIVLFVEGGVKMVHNGSEVALQGVVVDRALTVAIDAVVYVGNGCFRRPLRDAHRRVLHDLADNLWLEWTAMCEDPVGVVVRHGGPVTVLLIHHLPDDGFAVFVAWRWDVGPFLDALDAEDLERPRDRWSFGVEWLELKSKTFGYVGIGPHEDIVKEPAEFPYPQTHRLCRQVDVLDYRTSRIGLDLQQESLELADEHGHL